MKLDFCFDFIIIQIFTFSILITILLIAIYVIWDDF